MRKHLMQSLESRLLLSGDVLASINAAGELVLIGDQSNNAIAVAMDPGGGISVAAGDAVTTVNGAGTPAILTGWTGGIRMRLGDGNDTVTLTALTVSGNVRFDGGRGDNTLTVDSTAITGALSVKNLMGNQTLSVINGSSAASIDVLSAQRGNTTTLIENATVTGRLKFNSKDGADSLTLRTSQIGSVHVDNHKGDSTFTVDGCTVTDTLWFRSMQGQDVVDMLNATSIGGKVRFRTGDKGSTIHLTALTAGQLDLSSGKGSDVWTLDAVSVAGPTQIRTDKGNDQVSILNATVAPAGFAGTVRIDLGHGDDQLDAAAAFGDSVTVNGGRGTDTLVWLATSTFAVPAVTVQVETIT